MVSNRRYLSARILSLGLATMVLVAITGRAASAVEYAGTADPSAQQTLFTTQAPTIQGSDFLSPWGLAVAMLSDVPGEITAVRFWKNVRDTGPHVGRVFSATGQLLAVVTFVNETVSGWQQQALATPVTIAANTEFVISVSGTGESYAAVTLNGFASPLSNAHLRTAAVNAGRYGTWGGSFPSGVSPHNFFRDIVFISQVSGGGDTPPGIALTPATGSTVSGAAVAITASASDDVGVAGVQLKVDGVNVGAEITSPPYTGNWDSRSVANGTHTLAAIARDTSGQLSTASVIVTVNNSPPSNPPAPGVPVDGAVSPSRLLWNHDSVSAVAGFAITIDNVRADDQLTPIDSNGTCGCSMTLPFWGGQHTIVVSAYNADGETSSAPLVVGPIANPGGPYSGQVGSAIAFNAGLSLHPAGSIVSYEWTWGDGTGSPITGSPAASHVYASSGTFTLTLRAIDNAGAIATATGTVNVSPPSVVPPVAPANVVVGPNQIAWSHSAGASMTGFAITIDNVRSDYQRTPLAANGTCGCTIPLPFSGGRHTIVVSAYNAGGETPSVPVVVGPIANAGGPYSGQAGSAITVSGSLSSHPAGSIASYEWTWGDGTANSVSASASVSHTYANSGPFTLTLKVTDSGGGTATATATVNVSAAVPVSPPAAQQTLFTTQVPTIQGTDFLSPWDLGVALLSDVPGQITAVRFWKNVGDTGPHVGRVFSATGQLLAVVTFVNETASGWQQQALATPVTIAANSEYVISVSSTAQFYAAVTLNGFASPLSNAHLRTAAVNAGRYGTLGGRVPTGVAPHNFFRDVIFAPTP